MYTQGLEQAINWQTMQRTFVAQGDVWFVGITVIQYNGLPAGILEEQIKLSCAANLLDVTETDAHLFGNVKFYKTNPTLAY